MHIHAQYMLKSKTRMRTTGLEGVVTAKTASQWGYSVTNTL